MDDRENLEKLLRRSFGQRSEGTLGLEEEVMLLDPATLDLLPRAAEVVVRQDPQSIKEELPASQIELATPATRRVAETAAALAALRTSAIQAADGIGVLAASGVHPFAAPESPLSDGEAYRSMALEYGCIARRQLVFGLHVHVGIEGLDRAVGVYNALRSYLPELAALAATGPFHGGADTGLQSYRPKLAENLPRQGVPPAFADGAELAGALEWGVRSGALRTVKQWWWELRLHPYLGTVEVRVCDAQPTVERTAALAALVQCLCLELARRHDRRELPAPAPTWRIEQNRWSACRHGVHGLMADLRTGRSEPTRDRLIGLVSSLVPVAAEASCSEELDKVYGMIDGPAPDLYRGIAKEKGLKGLVEWLVQAFSGAGRLDSSEPVTER